MGDRYLELESEFASVKIELDDSANGPRILISDKRGGGHRYLDPLVIEGLVWAAEEQLLALVDPSKRWILDEREARPGGL